MLPIIALVVSGATSGGVWLSKVFSKNAGLKSSSDNSAGGKLSYKFQAAHTELQQRIDHILGPAFERVDGEYLLYKSFEPLNGQKVSGGGKEDYPNIYEIIYSTLGGSSFLPGNITTAQKAYYVEAWINQGDLVITRQPGGGWKYVSWMHWDTPEQAMEGVHDTAIGTDPNNFSTQLNPGDNYKCYDYPSQAVADQYGNNLPFYVRDAPMKFKLFGASGKILFDIILVIGATAATIITEGAAAPALIAAVTKLTNDFIDENTSKDAKEAAKIASDMVKIYNGAAIEVEGGTDQEMRDIAGNFVNNNGAIYQQA